MLLRGKMWRGIILREGGYGGHINLITKEKIQHGSQSLPQTQFFFIPISLQPNVVDLNYFKL